MPLPTPGPGRYGAPLPEATTTPAGRPLLDVLELLDAEEPLELVLLLLPELPHPAAMSATNNSAIGANNQRLNTLVSPSLKNPTTDEHDSGGVRCACAHSDTLKPRSGRVALLEQCALR